MNINGKELEELVDKYLDREFEFIQSIDFPPLREHPILLKSCENEWKNLCIKELSWKTRSSIVPYFNQSLIYANKGNHLSPYEYWQELKRDKELFRKFLTNRYKNSDWYNEKDNKHFLYEGYCPDFIYGIGLSTSGKAPRVSYFKPSQMALLVNKYAQEYDTIFDPFAGYAGRLVGTLACGKKYIGQDISDIVIEENTECAKWLSTIVVIDYELRVQDFSIDSGEYECLITCPPYSNEKGKQIEEWRMKDGKKISCQYTCDEIIDMCLERYKCKKYIFVVDGSIKKYKDYVVDKFTNINYLGARNGKHTDASLNDEYIVVIQG